MKNIHTILSEIGITIPDDKKAEFDKAHAENYKTSAEFEKKVTRLTDDLAAEKKRADDAVETLKSFEGKDFDAITKDRDKWKQDYEKAVADHKKEQEDREFNEILSAAISESKGKNEKAIMALLDMEKLRSSRNQEKDIKSALDALRTDSGYLFDDNGGTPQIVASGNTNPANGKVTREDIMKISDRAERRAAMAKHQYLFNTKGE